MRIIFSILTFFFSLNLTAEVCSGLTKDTCYSYVRTCIWDENSGCLIKGGSYSCKKIQSEELCTNGDFDKVCFWTGSKCRSKEETLQGAIHVMGSGVPVIPLIQTHIPCDALETESYCKKNPSCLWKEDLNKCLGGRSSCAFINTEDDCKFFPKHCYWDGIDCHKKTFTPTCSKFRKEDTCAENKCIWEENSCTSVFQWRATKIIKKVCFEMGVGLVATALGARLRPNRAQ